MYEIFEQLLQTKGLTAYQVSKKTGISQATLSAWKKGSYTPKQDKLQKIANFFDVSIDYLLGRSGGQASTLNQQLDGLDFALYGEVKELTDEQKQDILDYARFKKAQWRKENDGNGETV